MGNDFIKFPVFVFHVYVEVNALVIIANSTATVLDRTVYLYMGLDVVCGNG